MEHADHVALLRGGLPDLPPAAAAGMKGRPIWADLGSGTGAFTLALADLLGPGATIYSVDRDGGALRQQERAMQARFPQVALHTFKADLADFLPDLPPLDGVVKANVLHFFRDKPPILERVVRLLRPGGRLLLVEYNVDRGNVWVPYPLSYRTWEALAARTGLAGTQLLATRPSRFLHEIYSAASFKNGRQARSEETSLWEGVE